MRCTSAQFETSGIVEETRRMKTHFPTDAIPGLQLLPEVRIRVRRDRLVEDGLEQLLDLPPEQWRAPVQARASN